MQVEAILQSKGTAVHTLPAGASVRDAVDALNKHNIGAVIVMDGDASPASSANATSFACSAAIRPAPSGGRSASA